MFCCLRENLTSRQSNRRLTVETNGSSKELIFLEKQLWMPLAYYHFVRPHHGLCQKPSVEEPTRGTGSSRRWRPVTPAMAAGLTDLCGVGPSCFPFGLHLHFWINCQTKSFCFTVRPCPSHQMRINIQKRTQPNWLSA